MPRADGSKAARNLRAAAFALMAGFAVAASLVLVAETLVDPSSAGVLGMVGWALTLIGLSAMALRWPAAGGRVLGALTVVTTALWLWFALAPGPWIDLMDERGPLLPLLVLAVVLPMVVLAIRDPRVAGRGLLALGLGPGLAQGVLLVVHGASPVGSAERAPAVLLGAAVASGALPALLAGALVLAAVALDRRSGAATPRGSPR